VASLGDIGIRINVIGVAMLRCDKFLKTTLFGAIFPGPSAVTGGGARHGNNNYLAGKKICRFLALPHGMNRSG
jgi:hypothetical protein